jgi:hypothetical protein
MPDYFRQSIAAREPVTKPVHIFFFFTDHFEPGDRIDRMRRWRRDYPTFAARHRDSTGRMVQHTWFYPAEQPIDGNMLLLKELVAGGYGEVELHYHHGYDTEQSAHRKFQDGITYFQKFGFLRTIDGQTRFAFIHGMWGLDNSLGDRYCGVNREIALLRDLGCFADFTFPSLWMASQPPFVNNIYEATDDDRPKSYDHGVPLQKGRKAEGDLLIFQGPLTITPVFNLRKLFFTVNDEDIHPTIPTTPWRVDQWVRANVHVQGKPEWVFVKVHGHNATSDGEIEEAMGSHFDNSLSYLETHYNDGSNYVLHYITAREAFNLVRAAADGQSGDPSQYLDWVVKPYAADPPRRGGSE